VAQTQSRSTGKPSELRMVQESREHHFILRILIVLEVVRRMYRFLRKYPHMPVERSRYKNLLIPARLNAPYLLVMNLHLILQVQLLVKKQHIPVPVRGHDPLSLHLNNQYIIRHVSHL
jgi:hypothetical protein